MFFHSQKTLSYRFCLLAGCAVQNLTDLKRKLGSTNIFVQNMPPPPKKRKHEEGIIQAALADDVCLVALKGSGALWRYISIEA